ncbi:MAG: hypothetical protein SYR96_40010 [Actinomycetota bacterium]|nr:hypothetical protein [Actinomycetota bacterium]
MIRVAEVGNDKLVAAGLRALPAGADDIELVHSATNMSEHLAVAPPADVVLLDLRHEDGTEPAANVTAQRRTGVRVIVFSAYGDRRHMRSAIPAVDEPVDDVRRLVHEYDPGGRPVGSPRGIVGAAVPLFARPRWSR